MVNKYFITLVVFFSFLFSQNSPPLIVTGNVHGQLDPCGWPKKPLGGLSKKLTTINQLKSEGISPIILDSGDLLFKSAILPDSTLTSDLFNVYVIIEGYEKIGCDVINIGQNDLSAGLPFILEIKEKTSIPFISANLINTLSGSLIFDPYIIIEKTGMIYGIIGLTNLSGESDSIIEQIDYIKEGNKYISKLKNQTDIIILLVNSERSSYNDLPTKFPDADMIFTSGSTMLTRPSMKQKDGGPFVFSSGREGRYLNQVQLSLPYSNKEIVNISYLESRIKYLNRRLDRYMDKFPGDTYVNAYADKPNILNIFKESKKEIERLNNRINQDNNILEFKNIPMGKSIVDESEMLNFVNRSILKRESLKNGKKL